MTQQTHDITKAWADINEYEVLDFVSQIWAISEMVSCCRGSSHTPRIVKIVRIENPSRPTFPTFRVFLDIPLQSGGLEMLSFLPVANKVVVGCREDALTDVYERGTKTLFVFGSDYLHTHFMEMWGVLSLWSCPEQFRFAERTRAALARTKGPPKFFRDSPSRVCMLSSMSTEWNKKTSLKGSHPQEDKSKPLFINTLPESVVNENPILYRNLTHVLSHLKMLLKNTEFLNVVGPS